MNWNSLHVSILSILSLFSFISSIVIKLGFVEGSQEEALLWTCLGFLLVLTAKQYEKEKKEEVGTEK